MNKKLLTTLIIIGGVLLAVILVVALFSGSYNGMVKAEEALLEKQSNIESQLQRRADLIPNFVATVKGYAAHEEKTYTAVTEARNALQNAGSLGEKAEASQNLDSAIDVWVNAVTESYPELKANQNFIALQDELAGTENRINKARTDYNEAATEYNTYIRSFPRSLLAGMFGFEKAERFEAAAGAENAPTVSF